MRVFFLTYGTQSNVVRFLSNALRARGVEVEIASVADRVTYRHPRFKVPSPRPANLLNSVLAMRQFGRQWRSCFRRTDYAFHLMTADAQRCLAHRKDRFDIILQSGAVFSASRNGHLRPYCLYLDHTYAISKRYPAAHGLLNPPRMSARWEEMEAGVYRSADAIFTMSEYVRRSLVVDYGVSATKVEVVGAGPNLSAIPEERTVDGGRTILFIGREFDRKGGPVLLKAFGRLLRRLPDARLIIAGVPPNRLPALPHSVEVVGPVPQEDVAGLYRRASVFALPTLREPFGLVFLEAMAFGLPCVGTDVEAVPEIISDGETGFLVPPGDEKALEEKLYLLLTNRDLAASMGRAGRERVLSRFTWDRVAGMMTARFEFLIRKVAAGNLTADVGQGKDAWHESSL